MRRILLVLALVALLVVAAVVPAVADPSPTGIVPNLARLVFYPDAFGTVLPASWEDDSGDSSDSSGDSSDSISTDSSDTADGSDGGEASLNASDSDAENSGSSNSGSSSSGSSSSGSSVSQEFESEDIESGEASPSVDISNTGDNANLCAAIAQSANTGNVSNQQGATQYGTETDDIEFEGSTITITPELAAECTQTIEQSGAAGA